MTKKSSSKNAERHAHTREFLGKLKRKGDEQYADFGKWQGDYKGRKKSVYG